MCYYQIIYINETVQEIQLVFKKKGKNDAANTSFRMMGLRRCHGPLPL